ncbi:hypothetical protein LshimejAT787_1301790 [Lyophyllum shimeji]|uniref:Uncharacterized protein n=1 Tax=Lyophyllum shimeji TaxID=47721 RepID=A0A9P3PX97_LYOSH|nr:hypothetical protein LshimejAT787_1301790 [Lyophyllum shimeji]
MPLHHMFMPTPLLASSLLLSGASASLVYVPAIFVRDLFTTPYNVSSTPGELGLVAVKGNLLERQSCAPGWASCTAAFGCCIAGDNCCSNGGVLLGCCRAGSQCGVNNVGQLVCNAVGGGGTDSCADQGRVPCSHVNNACCPVGTDCTTVNNNIVCAPINSVPPTPQPSPGPTTSNTIVSTSTGPGPQPSPSIDQAELSQLLECQPCGSSQCSFSSAQNLADTTYDVLVGSAVTNCNGGSTSIKSTIGGSLTVGSSWSIGSTIGAELGVLKLESQYTYGQQQSVQLSQTLEIEIEPGKQVRRRPLYYLVLAREAEPPGTSADRLSVPR